MYKCKECGAEYEEKPDYCDCGNDEFEQVVAVVNQKETVTEKERTIEILQEKAPEEKPNVRPAASGRINYTPPPKKKSFSEQYPGLSRMASSVDPISLVIFGICILLSLYVVFFAWNPKEQEVTHQEKQETVVAKNIPSIDKIWNNTPPVYKQPAVKTETQEEKSINQIIQSVIPQKTTVQKPVQTQKTPQVAKPVQTTKSTVTKTQSNKTTQTTKPKTTNTAVTKIQTKQTTANTQAQAQKAAQDAAKKKAEQERAAAEAAQIQKLKAEQAKKAEAEKARKAAAAKQELANYKVQLRNTIGRKIDFTRVIGDGSCTVAFKIDSTGRLVSRSFAKQSSNNTLNDAVYAAVMATPTFSSPPSAYNNEMLNLNIKFYNGNFEISLP